MKCLFRKQSLLAYVLAGWSLVVVGCGYADTPSLDDVESGDSSKSEVLTPGEAGRIFLQNAGNFTNEGANSNEVIAGRTVTADFADGNFRVKHAFHSDGKSMTWDILAGFEQGQSGTVPYQAYELRNGIILVMLQPLPHESVLLVIDDNRGLATGYLARITDKESEQPIVMKTLRGPILEAGELAQHNSFEPAEELVGKRFTVTYPNEVAIYEHIYLTEHYVTWLGKKGTSAGVADTEQYESVEIAPDLYLVAWNEKSAPLQLSILFDFENRTELAALFGYDEKNDRPVYQTTSAKISDIRYTHLPK